MLLKLFLKINLEKLLSRSVRETLGKTEQLLTINVKSQTRTRASAPGLGIQVNENENPLDYRLGC